jgi:hypothetical protein
VAAPAVALETKDGGNIADFYDSIRQLVSSITVHAKPNTPGIKVDVRGRLAELCGVDAFANCSASGGLVVAGERYSALPTIADALFSYLRRAA